MAHLEVLTHWLALLSNCQVYGQNENERQVVDCKYDTQKEYE